MEQAIKIRLNYQKNYSFGTLYSGYDWMDCIYIENATNMHLTNLKIVIRTNPDLLLQKEITLAHLAPLGSRLVSCDFAKPDLSFFAELKELTSVSISVLVFRENNELLGSAEFVSKISPYYYFAGMGNAPETLAYFSTPQQPDLLEFDRLIFPSSPIETLRNVYQDIKNRKITYSGEDYSGVNPLPVKLCERVLKEKNGNALEFGLLFSSICERAGFSPVLLFEGKNKIYSGISLKLDPLPLLKFFNKFEYNADDFYWIDCSYFAYGSELDFDSALFHSKNKLQLTDEPVTLFSLEAARKYHLISLPNRVYDSGRYFLDSSDKNSHSGSMVDYYPAFKEYSDIPAVSSILSGGPFKVETVQKISRFFDSDLDVNQNKILGKIMSNNFTLISAQTGSGASTIFSKAALNELKSGKKVLYLYDPRYHRGDFEAILSRVADPSFLLNFSEDAKRVFQKSDLSQVFQNHDDIFSDLDRTKEILRSLDEYYANLEGGKKIVSSFLFAAERYHQLRDANDAIIFSPEQIGMLSDEVVQSWFGIVNDAVKALGELEFVHNHPLRLIRHSEFSYEYKSKLIKQLEDALHSLECLISLRDQISPHFPSMEGIATRLSLKSFNELTALFSEFQKVPLSFFEDSAHIEENFKNVTSLIQAKNENDGIFEAIRISFDEAIFQLDAIDLHSRYEALSGEKGFKARSQRNAILKSVKRFLLPNCDVENVEYILSKLDSYQKNLRFIEEQRDFAFRLLSVRSEDTQEAWKALQIATDLCYQCNFIFQNNFSCDRLFDFVCDFAKALETAGLPEKLAELCDAENNYKSKIAALDATIHNRTEISCYNSETDFFSEIYRGLSEMLSSVDCIKSWCFWLSVRESALQNGMKNMILAIENGKVKADELKKSFLRAFFKASCEFNFMIHPELIPDQVNLSKLQEEWNAAMDSYRSKYSSELNAILSAFRFERFRFPEDSFTPVQLLEEGIEALLSAFPVIATDLETGKKYFREACGAFDLILVENRSEFSISELLWVFSAGKKVAFAGSFSDSYRRSDKQIALDSPAFDYLWKITDEKYRLSACYRENPSMTSAKAAYAEAMRSSSRCYSVPAVCAENSVQWLKVSGTYDSEFRNANLSEAQAVVDYVIRALLEEKGRKISVITATKEQKLLILGLIAQKVRHQEDLSAVLGEGSGLSVNALSETVSFADVVIFSATFTPDRSRHNARLPFEFLEFAGMDPKKKMYQVLSSAREKLVVFSCFDADELRHTATVLPVLSAIRILTDLSAAPAANNSYVVKGLPEESGVIKYVGCSLEELGFQVLYGVQSGRYFIDLVITDENGNFTLGILSDRTVLNQNANVSAIEISNCALYEKNGWTILRFHSSAAFDSLDGEFQRVLSALSYQEPMELI